MRNPPPPLKKCGEHSDQTPMGRVRHWKGKALPPRVQLIIGAVMMFIPTVFGPILITEYQLGQASLEWPTVTGVVVQTEVVRERRSSSGGRRGRGSSSRTVYVPMVHYSYLAEGKSYQSNRWNVGDGRSYAQSERAYEALETTPPGTPLEIAYDPGRPAYAVAEPGVPLRTQVLLGLLALIFFLGAAAALVGITRGRKKEERARFPVPPRNKKAS